MPATRFISPILASCIALALSLPAVKAQEAGSPIIIAVQSDGSTEVDREFILQSERYLSYALSDRPIIFRRLPFHEIQKLAEERDVNFAITSADNYTVLERFFGARELASQKIRESASVESTAGIVVVANDDADAYRDLGDLSDASILVESRADFSAKILRRELIHAGLSRYMLREVSRESASAGERGILRAVAQNPASVGIISACTYERLVQKEPELFSNIRFLTTDRVTQTNCLSSSVFYPGWTLSSFHWTEGSLNALVSGTLLGMPTTEQGDDWKTGARSNTVHELLQTIASPGYLRQGQFSWAEFFKKYSMWFALLGLAVLGMFIHSVRAESLIRRRTSELVQTMQEKKRVELEAKRYNERLQAMERVGLIGELSSMIAHELKQPLAVIRNYSRGLARAATHDKLDAELVKTVVNKIDTQSTKAADIIDHVRSFAKHNTAELKPVDLSSIVRHAAEQFSASQEVSVATDIAPSLYVRADALGMELVVSNLLKNAVEAVEGIAEPRVALSLEAGAADVRLCVRDNGPRLSDEAFGRLAVPLSSSKPQGLGLGLTIVRRIVEESRGSLSFERLPECGLLTMVTLPLFNLHGGASSGIQLPGSDSDRR